MSESEQIDPAELGYHAHALAGLKQAEAVWRSWGGYLAQRYELGPGDHIADDGVIHRAPAEPDSPA